MDLIAGALGVFIANWLVFPMLVKNESFKTGFLRGIISAVLFMILFGAYQYFVG